MKIRQLIKFLEKYPEDTDVYVWDHFTGFDIDADIVSECQKPYEVEVDPKKFIPGSKNKKPEKFIVLFNKNVLKKISSRIKLFKRYDENGEVPPCITAKMEEKIPLNKTINFN